MSLTYLMSVKGESLGEFLGNAPSRGFSVHKLENGSSWQLLDAYDGGDALVVTIFGNHLAGYNEHFVVGPDHVDGAWIEARRAELNITWAKLVRFLDSRGASGWTPARLGRLVRENRSLDMLATREFIRAFGEAAATQRAKKITAYEAEVEATRPAIAATPVRVVCSNTFAGVSPAAQAVIEDIAASLDPRSWEAVRRTPAFAVALDIARTERNSSIKLDTARTKLAAVESECEDGYETADAFNAAHRFFRNDNNVLWGAARMLAAMVDNDDELGALSVLRAELDRQDSVTTTR